MDTKILEYLIAIADEKNISRAADLFYLSQPVLSRHLKNVEQELGTKLFYRERNEMKLTDAGKIYINNARAILYTEQKLIQTLDDLRRGKKRTIRVMIDPYLVHLFNRSVLPNFEGMKTEFELEVSQGDCALATDALHNDLTDIAIIKSAPLEEGRMETQLLYRDEMVMAVPNLWTSPDSGWAAARQGPWAFQERCFLMERSDRVMRQEEQRIMQRFQFKPRMVYEVSGSATALQMVKARHGVAFLPRALVEAHLQTVTPYSLEPPEAFNIYALYSGRRVLREAEKRLLKLLAQTYSHWDDYLKKIAGKREEPPPEL